MADRNPRSKLRTMKRQYFFMTFFLAFGLFLVVYLPMEILFTIFECGPYVRLGLIAALFFADYLTVNYLVNHLWNDKWKREVPELLDEIKAPEPAYVMDEETAKKLEETAKIEKKKKNSGFLAHLYRSLSPSDDAEEMPTTAPESAEVHPAAEEKPVPSRMKKRREAEAAMEPENLPVKEVQEPQAAAPEEVKEEPQVPSHRKKRNENETVPEPENREKAEPKPETQPSKKAKKQSKKKPERKNKKTEETKTAVEETTPVKTETESGSWMTPLDEMKTEELETAVENALRQGYNPTSNERNK
ncbi:MAG: hypothetical protein IKE28_07745 [Solobacterium sp.]|nr:hypothetical protein [Solobacterium sp.]